MVAFNSLFQVLFFAVYAHFFATLLPTWLGLEGGVVDVSIGEIAASVSIYLDVPFAAGFLTRRLLVQVKGREWYETHFVPRTGADHAGVPALLDRRHVLAQGRDDRPAPARRAAYRRPAARVLLAHVRAHVFMRRRVGANYRQTATLSLTAASNNFELAIAVAIASFGIHSGAAFAAGPLVEVPVLIGLVNVVPWGNRRFFPDTLREGKGLSTMGRRQDDPLSSRGRGPPRELG